MKMARLLGFSALASMIGSFGQVSPSMFAPAPRVGPKRKGGDGARRAQERLKAKLKANKAIPSGEHETRQQRRAEERADAKHFLSVRKQHAMKNNLRGGAAEIRA